MVPPAGTGAGNGLSAGGDVGEAEVAGEPGAAGIGEPACFGVSGTTTVGAAETGAERVENCAFAMEVRVGTPEDEGATSEAA